MISSVSLVNGHYSVGMLWKSEDPRLPENKQMAETRLQSLKRKLKRDENFHRKFKDFIDNLVSKRYSRKLNAAEVERRGKKTWYLPHHGVFHPQKKDKIRVVFDAALLHDGVSLSKKLHQGPDHTNSFLAVLMSSRQDPAELFADIDGIRQKYLMYLCICSQMPLRKVMACALLDSTLFCSEGQCLSKLTSPRLSCSGRTANHPSWYLIRQVNVCLSFQLILERLSK